MEPKDTSERHFRISLIKSSIRIVAGTLLMAGNLFVAGALFIAAEILGIVEEL